MLRRAAWETHKAKRQQRETQQNKTEQTIQATAAKRMPNNKSKNGATTSIGIDGILGMARKSSDSNDTMVSS